MLWMCWTGLAAALEADAGLDFLAYEGQTIELAGRASAEPADFEWVRLSGPPAELSDPGLPNPRFTATQAGTYTWELTVSDGAEQASDTVTVSVVHTDIGTVHAPTGGCGHAPAGGALILGLAALRRRRR